MSGDHFEFGGEVAWRPTPEYTNRSRLKAFIDRHHLSGYDDLLRRSTTDLDWFWNAVIDDLGIEFYKPYRQVMDTSRGVPWTRWCVDGQMNIIHNCLDKRMGTPDEKKVAVRWEGEEGATRTLTYGELHREVNRCANGIGGITLPLFSGYGADAVATRLRDAEARALVTADGFWRRGQVVAMKEIADEAADAAPSVQHVLVVPRLGDVTSHGTPAATIDGRICSRASRNCARPQGPAPKTR
jgi:acetyl-CoA synthetase